jgi:hypothetical protein
VGVPGFPGFKKIFTCLQVSFGNVKVPSEFQGLGGQVRRQVNYVGDRHDLSLLEGDFEGRIEACNVLVATIRDQRIATQFCHSL